jgi:hypothetical protein
MIAICKKTSFYFLKFFEKDKSYNFSFLGTGFFVFEVEKKVLCAKKFLLQVDLG